MIELSDLIFGVLLAYWWNGFEMVEFHRNSNPIDRPGYVEGPYYKRMLVALGWPFVAKANSEFGWFFCCFLSYAVVLTVTHGLLSPHLSLTTLIAVVFLLKIVPIVGFVFNAPAAIISSIFWMLIAKPMGAKIPSAIERMNRK